MIIIIIKIIIIMILKVNVEAMIISTSWNEGEWSTLCQTFRVREDTGLNHNGTLGSFG